MHPTPTDDRPVAGANVIVLPIRREHPPPRGLLDAGSFTHQSPVLRLSYLDSAGRAQQATLSSTARLVGISNDPVVQEIFLQAVGAALAVCGNRLLSAQSISSECLELDCAHLYADPVDTPAPAPGERHVA